MAKEKILRLKKQQVLFQISKLRKKAEGKHTMLVLNNIKCKMVHRIFTVIQRKSNFVNLHKFAA
ncbi:hypothetical protein SDC9_162911 [bioreactor metagenome]|uniref:Uncharacterized protein n=1 Tax=bioreactor metagenome TaxID=1076179 RepID=A0A645FME2_9ZZZZ|nr:hypothetical protein [Chryseobacterium koreense]